MSHCPRALALIVALAAVPLAGCESTIESLLPAVPDPCADAPAPGEVVTVTRNAPATTEGLVFGIDGRLYVSTKEAVHVMTHEGEFETIVLLPSALGLHAEPGRLLVAGFETAELYTLNLATAATSTVAGGLGQPNFVVAGPRGGWLVSDDFTDRISEVTPAGDATIWTRAVTSPNGMAWSPDHRTLYVASTFAEEGLYALPVAADGSADDDAVEDVATFPAGSAPDGITITAGGAVYAALNTLGQIARVAPDGAVETAFATGLEFPASLAIGPGGASAFDGCSLWATSLLTRKIFRVGLHVEDRAGE